MSARAAVWTLALSALAAVAAPAPAQSAGSALLATRDALGVLAARADSAGLPTVAAALRRRLEDGDFRPGDRILLRVDGEIALTDTFQVTPAVELLLPAVGPVPLRGILRSELQSWLATYVGRVIRDPVVAARATIPLAVLGEVARPGYYAVPVDGLLGDLMMVAGGPTRDAKLAEIRLERGGRPIYSGPDLERALAHGRTVADAGLEAGDRLFVPRRGSGRSGDTLRSLAIILSIPAAIAALAGIF